ncbi:unnamed protein product [Cuscuta campestris]|uniref:Uncharacterized protein n=1 Tax=Cuscuta campestris TaxID=132261 RepID=A0A484KZH4_9ASTE|nr:unnamed protein product [Cuscuta campestris]
MVLHWGTLVQMEEDVIPPLVLALEDTDGSKETNIKSHVGDTNDGESKVMKTIDLGSNSINKYDGANGGDAKSACELDITSCDSSAPLPSLGVVDISRDQALDANHQPFVLVLSHPIMMRHHSDILHKEHLISVRATRLVNGSISFSSRHILRSMLVESWPISGFLLCFCTLSPVQKHEWKPPP